jgi:uncharacterized membrane protein
VPSAAPAAYVFGKSFWHTVGGRKASRFQIPERSRQCLCVERRFIQRALQPSMSMTRTSGGDVVAVRVIGVLGAVLGVCAVAAGVEYLRAVSPARDICIFVIGAYLLAASGATIALRKVGALLLVVPLAALGMAAVIGSATQGPVVAVILNLLITAPLLCAPAYVVWRNRRALR